MPTCRCSSSSLARLPHRCDQRELEDLWISQIPGGKQGTAGDLGEGRIPAWLCVPLPKMAPAPLIISARRRPPGGAWCAGVYMTSPRRDQPALEEGGRSGRGAGGAGGRVRGTGDPTGAFCGGSPRPGGVEVGCSEAGRSRRPTSLAPELAGAHFPEPPGSHQPHSCILGGGEPLRELTPLLLPRSTGTAGWRDPPAMAGGLPGGGGQGVPSLLSITWVGSTDPPSPQLPIPAWHSWGVPVCTHLPAPGPLRPPRGFTAYGASPGAARPWGSRGAPELEPRPSPPAPPAAC